jgi:hypothetical protein
MARRFARAGLALLALCATFAATVGGTISAFDASSTTPSASFTAAADWTPPTASVAAIGRTTAYGTGFITQGATYYVYANVLDSGNPASGTASVTANVNNITSAHPAVALVAGSYSAGGIAYNYRTAALTSAATIAAGSYAFTITSTDSAANAGTQSFNVTVDNTPPTATDVQSTNVSGGSVGHIDQGDTFTLTYNSVIDPYSVLPGWTGASTKVQIALADLGSGADDAIYVYNMESTPSQLPVGVIDLGTRTYLATGAGQYITYGATGSATPSTMTESGSSIVFTLGTAGGASLTSNAHVAMKWTPSTAATDIAGNAVSATPATQSGSLHANF